MNRVRLIRAGLGLMALVAAGLSAGPRLIGRIGTSRIEDSQVADVLVARRYIPAFAVIEPEGFGTRRVPRALAPPGALTRGEPLKTADGRPLFMAAIAIPQDHPVTRALLIDAERPGSLTSLLRPGKVAVSFETDRAHGVGGWIRPGDTIAVYQTLPPSPNGRALRSTRLLFSSVLVIAVDRARLGEAPSDSGTTAEDPLAAFAQDAAETQVLTVLVSPPDASRLIEAREQGPVSVVLRPLDDPFDWPLEDTHP